MDSSNSSKNSAPAKQSESIRPSCLAALQGEDRRLSELKACANLVISCCGGKNIPTKVIATGSRLVQSLAGCEFTWSPLSPLLTMLAANAIVCCHCLMCAWPLKLSQPRPWKSYRYLCARYIACHAAKSTGPAKLAYEVGQSIERIPDLTERHKSVFKTIFSNLNSCK